MTMKSTLTTQQGNVTEHGMSFVHESWTKLLQLHIIHFQNVTFWSLLSLAVTDCARGYYSTVQRVFGKAKVF